MLLLLALLGGALCIIAPPGTPDGIPLAEQRACPEASKEDIQLAVQNIANNMTGNLMILHEEMKAEIVADSNETALHLETRFRSSLDELKAGIVAELKETSREQKTQFQTSLDDILKETIADLSGLNRTVNDLQLQMQQLGNELSNKSSQQQQQQAESFSVLQKLLDDQSEALCQKNEQQEAALQERDTRLEEQKQMLEQSLREHKESLQQLSERMGEELQQTKDDLSATKVMLQEALETIRPQKTIRQLSLWEEYGIKALDCTHHWQRGRKSSGVYSIYPNMEKPGIEVLCNMTAKGSWTVILSRSPQLIQENFTRNWTEYQVGFGNPSAEYWIGLEALHAMTNRTKHQLYVEVITARGNFFSGGVRDFHVDDESSKYRVTMGNPYGIGNWLTYNNGEHFSTIDEDNDKASVHCAQKDGGGGWWYNGCSDVFPTGRSITETNSHNERMHWDIDENRQVPLTHVVMAIRPQ